MSVSKKLLDVQKELKAPKGQFNSFGKYNYRSAEDILEALKPVLNTHKVTVYFSDDVELLSNGWVYLKATLTFRDTESEDEIVITAFSRESEIKKGMDASQITGTASSYARKYALNGLFLIDDTKDADTDEYQNQTNQTQQRQNNNSARKNITSQQAKKYNDDIKAIIAKTGVQDGSIMGGFLEKVNATMIKNIKTSEIAKADDYIARMKKKAGITQ